MRKLLLIVAAVAVIVAIPAVALGQPGGGPGANGRGGDHPRADNVWPPGPGGPGGDIDGLKVFYLRGEVASVDAAAGTITANVVCLNHGPGFGGRGPGGPGRHHYDEHGDDDAQQPSQPRQVTFKTDADTEVYLGEDEGTLSDLKPGDSIAVAIVADSDATRDEVLATPAFAVYVNKRPSQYGFAGKVTATDTAAKTLTVKVRYATRNIRSQLDQADSRTLTFTTDDATLFKTGSPDGTLADIKVDDVVAVGIKGAKGASLSDVLATPASVVYELKHPRPASHKRLSRLAQKAAHRAGSRL